MEFSYLNSFIFCVGLYNRNFDGYKNKMALPNN